MNINISPARLEPLFSFRQALTSQYCTGLAALFLSSHVIEPWFPCQHFSGPPLLNFFEHPSGHRTSCASFFMPPEFAATARQFSFFPSRLLFFSSFYIFLPADAFVNKDQPPFSGRKSGDVPPGPNPPPLFLRSSSSTAFLREKGRPHSFPFISSNLPVNTSRRSFPAPRLTPPCELFFPPSPPSRLRDRDHLQRSFPSTPAFLYCKVFFFHLFPRTPSSSQR